MTRYAREDWLEDGLRALAQEGVEALTIDSLCARLRVTKGSFYHHFANREAFLEALLLHWEAHDTHDFIAFSQAGRTPAERLARLQTSVIDAIDRPEVAIRAWAQHDPAARAVQERVDQQRMDYLYAQYLELTGDAARAHSLAQMVYAILIGAQTVMPPYSADDLNAIYELVQVITSQNQERQP